jgi:integrase
MARADRKHWSYVTGERGRNRVRVYTHPTTGRLFLEYTQDGRKTRTALGHRDREEAKRQADELAARFRRPEVGVPERITLAQLFDNYLREVTPTKGEHAQHHDRRASRLIVEILGPARFVSAMTHRDAARYIHERRRRGDQRGGASRGKPLRNRGVEQDLKLLQAVLNWAVGAGWIDRNPLKGFRHELEGSARRPIVTANQYEAMLAVADQFGPTFKLVLILAHETGHRIGAIQQLRWSDVDLVSGTVKWRAEVDKIRFEHVTPLTPAALEALHVARKARKSIGDGWLAPSPTEGVRFVSRHLLRDWWQRAQVVAGLPPETGRGWHSLRRLFATELKHTPLKDLCALGGWKSPQTILLCYQRADPVTMRDALATRMRLEG